jgi:predicted transcriptional regulator
MAGATVRISEETHQTLRELAARTGQPMQAIVDQAIEDYRRRRFFDELNRAFAALRKDPKQWEEELAEREAWDATLADGLNET